MTLSDSAASERWARAGKAAAGVTDHGTSKAVRTYYQKYLPREIGLFVGVGAVLAVSGFPFGPKGWAAYLGLGLSVAALVALIGGIIYGIKRVNPMVQPKRANASSLLEKQERKSVRAQMFGRVGPVPEHLPIVRGIAAQTRQGLAFQLVVAPGYLFLCLSQMLLAGTSGPLIFQWIWVPLACAFVFLVGLTARQFKQSGRFLDVTSTR